MVEVSEGQSDAKPRGEKNGQKKGGRGRGRGRRPGKKGEGASGSRGEGGDQLEVSGAGKARGSRKAVSSDGVKRGSVAKDSDVKAVAGYLANTLRSDGRVDLLAAGPPSVNRAIKAVCLARNYLESDMVDLVVEPEFLGTLEAPASNEAVLKVRSRPRDASPETALGGSEGGATKVEFNVAGGSVPTAVAGAIAKAVRKGDSVVAYAMGAQAVTRGFKATWKARTYLAEEGITLTVVPEFCKPEPGDTYSTKIAFRVLVARADVAVAVAADAQADFDASKAAAAADVPEEPEADFSGEA